MIIAWSIKWQKTETQVDIVVLTNSAKPKDFKVPLQTHFKVCKNDDTNILFNMVFPHNSLKN